MKRNDIISILVSLCMVLLAWTARDYFLDNISERTVRVGFLYDGDESTPYAYNFIRSQRAVETAYGDRVESVVVNNVPGDAGGEALRKLAGEGCEIIFSTSLSYAAETRAMAAEYPDIEFCQVAGEDANDPPVLANYHTFMGEIYQGRYVSGVLAGMKLKELIDQGTVPAEGALVGYIGAFPNAEVISGCTAFFLGVRAIVPDARMNVRYTDTWTSYSKEKEAAEKLIEEGCVVISQHSDTIGPAVACENADKPYPVIHVGYNQSMIEEAPTSSLVSTRINWTPYFLSAVEAVMAGDKIEKHVKGNIHGNDAGAGFDMDWVQMLELNAYIAAEGSQQRMTELEDGFRKGRIRVFQGDYIGIDPEDPTDIYDLSAGYDENRDRSAPSWHYVLKDVITVEE